MMALDTGSLADSPLARETPRLLGLTVVLHPRADRVGQHRPLPQLSRGDDVALSRGEPDFAVPGQVTGSPLADPAISRRPILLRPGADGGVCLHPCEGGSLVTVYTTGQGRPLRHPIEVSRHELDRAVILRFSERVVLALHSMPGPRCFGDRYGLVGESRSLWAVRNGIENMADLDVPVLITGETGSGKELVARAIHKASGRSGPLVAVNIAAVSPATLYAALFGHTRGAYTGADRARRGLFQRARGGTLFLDEVGDMADETQIALLRVLDTGLVQPLGGEPEQVDVRVLAATDADLGARVATGAFREALRQRLSAIRLEIRPLRERREDVGRLVRHFLERELHAIGRAELLFTDDPRDPPWLPARVMVALTMAEWPGNVRQLANVVRQIVVANRNADGFRLPEHLGALDGRPGPAPAEVEASATERKPSSDVTESELNAALERNGYAFGATAKELGMARNTLLKRVDASPTLRRPRDISRAEVEAAVGGSGDLTEAAHDLKISARGLLLRMRDLGLS